MYAKKEKEIERETIIKLAKERNKKIAAKRRTTLVRLETSGKRREISPPLSKICDQG